MGLGALYGRLYRKYQHGLRVAYYRDHVRRRILRTPPVSRPGAAACEIHVMTSARDWLDLMWSLKTFYHFSRRDYGLCIHDDGTLSRGQLDELHGHFPHARLIERTQADETVLALLAEFPHCLKFRQSNHLSPKVFDFVAFLHQPRMMLLDSDVLFFAAPEELLRRIENPEYRWNTVNRDLASAYTTDASTVRQHLGFELIERFNSGLGLIHKSSMRPDWIERFLTLPGVIGHFWRIEQTLFALCSSKFGCELLPAEYDVSREVHHPAGAAPSRHYIGPIRHLLYGQGIKHLVRSGFLEQLG